MLRVGFSLVALGLGLMDLAEVVLEQVYAKR